MVNLSMLIVQDQVQSGLPSFKVTIRKVNYRLDFLLRVKVFRETLKRNAPQKEEVVSVVKHGIITVRQLTSIELVVEPFAPRSFKEQLKQQAGQQREEVVSVEEFGIIMDSPLM